MVLSLYEALMSALTILSHQSNPWATSHPTKAVTSKLLYFWRMFPPCIFCNNESGSEEHLWAAWMHRLLKFGSIRVQEGTSPETIDPDPEKTINTVCHTCNNTWMSQLEEKNIHSLRPMLQNQATIIDPGRQRLLTEWGVKTAMVQDSIKPGIGNEKFYTDAERLDMRLTRKIPERTRMWIGALTEPHLGSLERIWLFSAATKDENWHRYSQYDHRGSFRYSGGDATCSTGIRCSNDP